MHVLGPPPKFALIIPMSLHCILGTVTYKFPYGPPHRRCGEGWSKRPSSQRSGLNSSASGPQTYCDRFTPSNDRSCPKHQSLEASIIEEKCTTRCPFCTATELIVP